MNDIEQNSSDDKRKIYKVVELTRFIKASLERQFGNVWIEGELSNVRQPASGHYYLTIKDSSAQISAVLFRGNQAGIKFQIKDGVQVRAFGQVSVYERSGSYQIILRTIEEAGKGSLQAQFEALKEKLRLEGLFDPARKKTIPTLARHIGIVTSDTGAAIRDILNVTTRRFPNLHIVLAPARVQGALAAKEVAAAIDLLNKRGGLDVMIIGRGGGSLEDLYCFNEEVVARAIAKSKIPIISAVGHEIDFTISDFVADLRAPTPSAAAELVVGIKDDFLKKIVILDQRINRGLDNSLNAARARLNIIKGHYVFREPANLIVQYKRKLDTVLMQMRHGLTSGLREGYQQIDTISIRMERELNTGIQNGIRHIDNLESRMVKQIENRHHHNQQRLLQFKGQLNALNPLAVLQRGYSVVRDADGRIIKSIDDIKVGELLVTQVSDGKIESMVSKFS